MCGVVWDGVEYCSTVVRCFMREMVERVLCRCRTSFKSHCILCGMFSAAQCSAVQCNAPLQHVVRIAYPPP